MPIQPNDMIPITLPAGCWDWIMEMLPQLAVPMQPRDQIVAMLQGQMKGHLARVAAEDAAAQAENQPASASPPADPAAGVATLEPVAPRGKAPRKTHKI